MNPRANQTGPTLARLCRWALGYAFRRWLALIAVFASVILRIGFDLLKPWPMVFLVDYVLRARPMPPALNNFVESLPGAATPINLAGWSVAATIVFFLLSWAVGLAVAYGNINLGQRMSYDLAGDLFAKLQQLSLSFHARKSVGDNIRRVTADSTCASVIVKDALIPILASVVSLVATFSVLWAIHRGLALLSLAAAPCMLLVFRRYAVPMMDLSYEQQESEGKIYGFVEETFSAMPVVQAFGRENSNDQRLAAITGETLASTLRLTNVQLQFKVLMGLVTALATSGILWYGASQALDGVLSIGAIILFLSYLSSLYTPLESIMYTGSTIQGAAGSARRVWEVLHEEAGVIDKPGAIALSRPKGCVQLEDVTVGYEPGRPVLRNVTLDVPVGQCVALVGATGAGKSTLVSLLPRFLDPWTGRVLLDGQDLRDVRIQSLRSQIAIVLQDPFLFPISIAENIAYGSPGTTREQVIAAARAANAHDFILRLPQGYDTVIGERGGTLSGGERQRISIARALLRNAPVLILDEPTSALDVETEHGLLQALEVLIRDRTTFIIAHRLSTIRRAHRIVVLDQGAIIENGTHDELLAKDGTYARFYRFQSGETPKNA